LQGDELELQSMCAGIALQVPLNSKWWLTALSNDCLKKQWRSEQP
jgi:hypothetical protein